MMGYRDQRDVDMEEMESVGSLAQVTDHNVATRDSGGILRTKIQTLRDFEIG